MPCGRALLGRVLDSFGNPLDGRPLSTADCVLRPVHAPIGLDIGAITPQEIAVSIVAELIAVKHGKIAEPNVSAMSMRWEGALKR